MKIAILLIGILMISCNRGKTDETGSPHPDKEATFIETNEKIAVPEHSNARFRHVTVEKTDGNSFRIRGEGQIFEASFSWVVEDGHNELEKGFQMTDAGAPEWGKFDFTIEAKKVQENSTLTLILFEASAKDGSRQHELPIALP